jgi:hypothetical protein
MENWNKHNHRYTDGPQQENCTIYKSIVSFKMYYIQEYSELQNVFSITTHVVLCIIIASQYYFGMKNFKGHDYIYFDLQLRM